MAYRKNEILVGYYSSVELGLELNPTLNPEKSKVYLKLQPQLDTLEKQCGVIDGLFPHTNDALMGDSDYEYYKELAEKELAKLKSSELLAA